MSNSFLTTAQAAAYAFVSSLWDRSGRRSALRMFALLVLSLNLLATVSHAQSSRGAVTGLVQDPGGAVVPNAMVTLASSSKGISQTAKTNSAGIYRFEAVFPGDYDVTVEVTGFAKSRTTATVTAGLTVGRDFTLSVARVGESVEVQVAAIQLQTEEATRGNTIASESLANLPISGQNSLNLMLTLPGVVRSNQSGSLDSGIGSINGARARSNHFMIDGIQNDDISVAGPAFTLTNNDALQEVQVQTSNFTAEYGRSGGGIVNQITKSGSNKPHGTIAWVYKSEVLDASNNTQRINYSNKSTTVLKNKYKENIPAFTFGAPVIIPHLYDGHDKTFFFVAGQWDRYSANGSTAFSAVPTDAGYATLKALPSACSNVATYLALVGAARGSSGTGSSNISIALPSAVTSTSCGGGTRAGQVVQVGRYVRNKADLTLDNNHLIRIDHVVSQKQNMMFRWIWDDKSDSSIANANIGINEQFDVPYKGRAMGANFNHTYLFKDNLVNEFRFGYVRNNFGWFFPSSTMLGATTPDIGITGLSSLAVSSSFPQGRVANSYQYQDAMGWTTGKHAIRFGVEILRQLAVQVAPFNSRGSVAYSTTASNQFSGGAITALANYIDNYSGTASSPVAISFGSGKYRPNLFNWSLYVQDTYKVRPDLTVNYGLRYENFGQPANGFKYPAFVGYGDTDITSTKKVNPDNNNLGPSVGFSWNPHWKRLLTGKTVVRGGYQVSYDTWFNNLLSNLAAGSPNALANTPVPGTSTAASPRGLSNLSSILPSLVPVAVTAYSNQTSVLNRNIRNPYYHHISLGVQHQLPGGTVVDVSYVGSLGRQLLYTNPLNPALPNSTYTSTATQSNGQTLRLYANRGLIQIRDSGLTSSYNSFQLQVKGRQKQTPAGGIAYSSAFTWAKSLDVLTEVFATNSSAQNPSRSPAFGTPLRSLDWGPSDNDRRNIWSSVLLWDVRGPHSGYLGQIFGGWSIAPLVTLQSGTPYTILNGYDRDLDGSTLGDRPDIGNSKAPVNTRALVVSTSVCSTGLQNPANSACVSASDVHWVQVTSYSPTSAKMVKRNANYTGAYFDVDSNILKRFHVSEGLNLEYRAEIFNLTNNQNFDTPPSSSSGNRSVTSATGTNFMNFALQNGGNRSVRMGLKLIF